MISSWVHWYAPSRWETLFHCNHCNEVSHWLGAYLDWSLWVFNTWFHATLIKVDQFKPQIGTVGQCPTRTTVFWGYPPPPPPPHDYPYHWVILDPKSKDKVKVANLKNSPKFKIFEFWNGNYTRHTFWSCLIRCANMKWIRWVFLKIQSGHVSVHRRTDGQGDTSIPPFQLRWSWGYNY